MKSAQEREEWHRQELRYRRQEQQIQLRWLWPVLLAAQALALCGYPALAPAWMRTLAIPFAAVSAVMGIRAWLLWSQHRRGRRKAAGHNAGRPAA